MEQTAEQMMADWEAEKARNRAIPRDEFLQRFKARMIERAGQTFDDGTSIPQYADEIAPSYYDDEDQRSEGPEECADADMSYWGE
jgi:hypothetical protein